eukprot:CAMPEP_0118956394 /NCGR_PEP_ID=MMETSP1169-20130426/61555_1 /TAXON_ID=36882 /ORGANISM="Pyramimonas obovata, Strain CCMP722" /LENGTH=415 /DNA_ID=CAMNT_0006904421 /DNA_START=324 /DNA_END=1571 /DNA_ORIENTATION=-
MTREMNYLSTEGAHSSQVSQPKRNLPVWFAAPTSLFTSANSECSSAKTQHFATVIPNIVPGQASTYVFKDEDSYYADYRKSYFAVTTKKSGWDCFRHYEILSQGAIPFFIDIEKIPSYTMYAFPKRLVQQAMRLPGVPSEGTVRDLLAKGVNGSQINIDMAIFDQAEYCNLRNKLLQYAREKLTTRALGEYVMEQYNLVRGTNGTLPNTLMISTCSIEYQSGFMFAGLKEVLGPKLSWYPCPKRILYTSSRHTPGGYGLGFGYKAILQTSDIYNSYSQREADSALMTIAETRLQAGQIDLVIVTNGENAFCKLEDFDLGPRTQYIGNLANSLGYTYSRRGSSMSLVHRNGLRNMLNDYLTRNKLAVVATVDGSDIHGCHGTFAEELPRVDLHFVRETEGHVTGQIVEAPITKYSE